jgi:hypothetical protein
LIVPSTFAFDPGVVVHFQSVMRGLDEKKGRANAAVVLLPETTN